MRRYIVLLIGILMTAGTLHVHAQGSALSRAEACRLLLLNRTDSIPYFPNIREFPDVQPGMVDERYILAAEHYGIISPDPVTGALRPDGVVDRATFLKMLTFTFGLPQALPSSYTDVQPTDWFAPYAGIAQTYGLFETDTVLRPGVLLNADEAIYAIALVKQARLHDSAPASSDGLSQTPIVITTKLLKTTLSNVPFGPPATEQPAQMGTIADLRQNVLALVNNERAKVGVAPLTTNAFLQGSAQAYAEEMAKGNFFSHVSPTGETLSDRMVASGYENRSFTESCHCVPGYNLGENLARGQGSPEQVVAAWMNSPPHREAILNPVYKETGIGISNDMWVEHFGAVVLPQDMAKVSK